MRNVRVGVLALQGDVSEHVHATKGALAEAERSGLAVEVRTRDEAEAVDGMIIPGGESTTIGRLLVETGIHDLLLARGRREGMPIWGSCAGLILLAKEGDKQVETTRTRLLSLMEFAVDRNAFGRQRDSFEAPLPLAGISGGPFPGVFIRAPAITRLWGDCRSLCKVGRVFVAAEQGPFLATAFHPELTGDLRLHRHFLSKLA
ncbi:MAG: pyridoxal 5'-phosphate synthase glutaminase subunit PdxT [Methanobacteriota archaeon]